MKKILLVLVMIAASVFLAQPAVADGETGETAATTEATSSETTEEIKVEEPPPAPAPEPEPVEQAPADSAPAAPADEAPADDAPEDDSAGKAPSNDSAEKPKQADEGTEKADEPAAEDEVVAAAPVKVWVCKYVGTPGDDERLKEGKNPIEISSNALPGQPDNPQVGQSFSDEHGRSFVVQIGGEDPGIDVCPPGDADTEVTTEDPILSPGTCESDGALTLPDTAGVLYTVTPVYSGDPGTYDVVATALDGYVLSANSVTEWNDLVVEAQEDPQDCVTNPDVKKVWVCKYVGKPGVDEVLKGGKNPIEVSVNALPGAPDNPQVGDEFSDAQERSVVVALSPADPEPTVEDCPPAIQPTEVTPEAPTVDPATCEADGSLNLPETEGVVYSVEPNATGPGDYVVTATAASDAFVLIGQTVFDITVDAQVPEEDCVSPEEETEDPKDDTKAKEDDLLPDTGGLPLWVLLLAGPMTAAGLLILMRRSPVDQASTGGRMPSYSLTLPPAKKPVGVKRAHASIEHIGFMKAVSNVVAAIGSFFRGGRR